MKTEKRVNGKNGLVRGILITILLLAMLFAATACEKNADSNKNSGGSQFGKKIDVDWDANVFSLEGVDPSSVNGSYVLKEEPDSEGDYDAEEIILWNGTYIHIWHEVLHHMSEYIDHPAFDMEIHDKGYYILRDNGTLTLIEENGDQIQTKAFYYFEDGDLVIEYYGAGWEITKKVYVKQ